MSEDQNFVILLLDTVDSRTITELLDEHPEYSEVFRDFTYFENTVGAYSCTERSVPYILSGDWYENDEPFDDYGKRVYQESPLFQTLQERGYNMELCDSELYMDTELIVVWNVLQRLGKDIRMQQEVSIQEQRLKLLIRSLEQLYIQSRVWMESYHHQQTTMFIHGNLIDLVLLLRSQTMPVMSALSVIMMMVPDVIS